LWGGCGGWAGRVRAGAGRVWRGGLRARSVSVRPNACGEAAPASAPGVAGLVPTPGPVVGLLQARYGPAVGLRRLGRAICRVFGPGALAGLLRALFCVWLKMKKPAKPAVGRGLCWLWVGLGWARGSGQLLGSAAFAGSAGLAGQFVGLAGQLVGLAGSYAWVVLI